ncbi:hypothetical protein VTO42DRAFT_1972 [Malbranchea cinnamomea]
MPYNITERETQPTVYRHINGTPDEILDRYCVAELCKGWPVYHDASEWNNYRDLFTDEDASVWTSRHDYYYYHHHHHYYCYIDAWTLTSHTAWSGVLSIDDFIKVSKEGRQRGDFIMHRENGTLVDLNPATNRAVGKMKATITQRFTFEGGRNADVECDCRFIFFCKKEPTKSSPSIPEWKAQYVNCSMSRTRSSPLMAAQRPRLSRASWSGTPRDTSTLRSPRASLVIRS